MQSIALITGASRGIGAATALTLAQAGYAVAVNYRDNSLAADEVVRQIRAQGGNAITVQADVAVEAEVLAMFAKVDAKLGPLTALVNNAGVAATLGSPGQYVDYAASKRAIDSFTVGLAHQVPQQRPGTAQEIANAIVWLLSDAASYTTGAILDVGGGR